MNKLKLLLGFSLFLASCEGNQIYFDMDEKVLKSCNYWNNSFSHFEIENDSLNLHYNLNWVSDQKPPKEIKFNKINIGYEITLNGITPIQSSEFKLLPNSSYKIINQSNGDASPSETEIYLSIDGEVSKTSKARCQQ